MKIGDKVRFLSETGGGIIKGFKDRNMVLVEDEDGFEIPMLANQVVVIDTNDYNIPKPEKSKSKQPGGNIQECLQGDEEKEITFRPKPVERLGGNMLNIYLAFTQDEQKDQQSQEFSTYLINDSNYYIQVQYLCRENASWKVRFSGTIEPNTKQFIEAIDLSMLNEIEHSCVQMFAYKEERAFTLKPSYSVALNIDAVKFYKPHTFVSSPFFRIPALIYNVVSNDESKGKGGNDYTGL